MVSELTPKTTAALDLMRRSGASRVDIRYSGSGDEGDCDPPLVWTIVALTVAGVHAGAAESIEQAVVRCAEEVIDGGQCTHCGRPTGLEPDISSAVNNLITQGQVCWYTFDPELATFRRACEGETAGRVICGFSWGDDGDHRHICCRDGDHSAQPSIFHAKHRCACSKVRDA